MQKDVILQISNKIKEKRKERHITVQELADKAGVTKGFISQIENNRTVPSLTVLLSIIRSLNIDLNAFFDELQGNAGDGDDNKVVVLKKPQYEEFQKENARGFLYQRILSTHVQDRHIDIVLLRLQKNSRRAMVRTDAFEFKYVISGEVEYTIGDKKYLLGPGDSIYFDARELHNPKNVGSEEALMLVIYFFMDK
jgi:transcriptional regulator with XRE-family HTH domain